MLNLICGQTRASRIRNAQNSGMWVPRQMFPDWFGLHRSQRGRLKMCWWWSVQSKRGGLSEWRKSRTECVDVSRASWYILTESCSQRYIIGERWAVACEYWLINRCIAGAMNLLTRYINFIRVSANSAKMLLLLALPQGQVSICEKDYQEVQLMMKTIIDGSRWWMDNTSKWVSTEHHRFVVL